MHFTRLFTEVHVRKRGKTRKELVQIQHCWGTPIPTRNLGGPSPASDAHVANIDFDQGFAGPMAEMFQHMGRAM